MCDKPNHAGVRDCSDWQAKALSNGSGWMGCDGLCLIREDANGVSIMNLEMQVAAHFNGAKFLAGAENTHDLKLLPFLAADGHLLLVDAKSHKTVANISLVNVVDGDPAAMPRFIEEARVSVDGRRFFVPSPDGPGFSVYEITGDRLSLISPDHPAMLISPSGRYGLMVDPEGDGTFRLMDYFSGASVATNVRFEIDTPFFDVDERYLLKRHRYKAGPQLSAFRLPDGEFAGTVVWPETASMYVEVSQGKSGVRMTDLSPQPD